jgi:regulator of nucleoside diphosphate kinase
MQHPVFLTDIDALRLRSVAHRLANDRSEDRVSGENLFELLDAAQVVPANAIAADVITMNSKVTYEDGRDGATHTLTLVYPGQADVAGGRVSVLSPLGRALLGARVGARVEFETPAEGKRAIIVRGVAYQPEAAGDWNL